MGLFTFSREPCGHRTPTPIRWAPPLRWAWHQQHRRTCPQDRHLLHQPATVADASKTDSDTAAGSDIGPR